MKVVFTARRIRAGGFEQFRRAWEPDSWPDGMVKAFLLRDPQDAELVIAFGIFEVSDQRAEELRSELEQPERERHERMAPHVTQTLVSGLFDVVANEPGNPTGDRVVVSLTERRLHPGTLDRYVSAAQAALESIGGALAPGLARVLMLRDTRDPDHMISLAIIRSGDLDATRQAARAGREVMMEAIEPFVAGVGLDATDELIEDLSPAHT
ncbi:MAG: hypothetical protein ACTHNU_14065 [Gaiellales bacterium]